MSVVPASDENNDNEIVDARVCRYFIIHTRMDATSVSWLSSSIFKIFRKLENICELEMECGRLFCGRQNEVHCEEFFLWDHRNIYTTPRSLIQWFRS